MFTQPHRVSAEHRFTWHEHKPIVTGRTGIVSGHRARLDALTVTVTALTQPDGSVGISTALDPVFDRTGWVYNPDQLHHTLMNLIELGEDQIPNQCRDWHKLLVDAVHALHPGLTYTASTS